MAVQNRIALDRILAKEEEGPGGPWRASMPCLRNLLKFPVSLTPSKIGSKAPLEGGATNVISSSAPSPTDPAHIRPLTPPTCDMVVLLFLSFAACTALLSGEKVKQTPSDMFKKTGESATIQCIHNVPSYNLILWYQNLDMQMQLLGYMYSDSPSTEDGVDVEIKGSAAENRMCQLIIPNVNLNSSALYYCAASYHTAALSCPIKS
nr:uncharacterized protein LOC133623543 [Nerophis lumbriciformis]